MDSETEQIATGRTETSAAYRVRMRLIGDFRAEDDQGNSILPVSRKARALLCIIAMGGAQGAQRAVAAALLWTSKNKDAIANSLRQALGELQPPLAALGRPMLLASKGGRLVLQPGAVWVDVLERDPAAGRPGPDDPDYTLCRDLRGLSPAFDHYLDRLWVEIDYRKALIPPAGVGFSGPYAGRPAIWQDTPSSGPGPSRIPRDSGQFFGSGATAVSFEKLDRFPQAFSATADIPAHQLGWRMAVLPFRSLGAPLGHGIALGMAEEVSAALARFRAPRLIATATFWDGVGPAPDAIGRCRTYHLDYIIDGTIQVVGEKVRVNVTLLDVVLDFEVIWSNRFEGSLEDLFSLQDRIASETVAQIDPELFQRRWAATASAKTEIAAAHHSVLTAIQGIFRLDRPKFVRARELLSRAIELDPDFSAAHAWLAYWCIMAVGQGWVDNAHEVTLMAGASAERAVLLDPLDARALAIAGHVKAYLLHDVKSALHLHARAIELNPNLPIAWTMSALSKTYSGDHSTAVRHALVAQSLSPRDPHIFFVEQALMLAYLLKRQLDEADMLADVVLERVPHHASALKLRVAILGHLGRREEAAEYLDRLRLLDPNLTVEKLIARPPFQPEDLEYYAEGLRRAGVPE